MTKMKMYYSIYLLGSMNNFSNIILWNSTCCIFYKKYLNYINYTFEHIKDMETSLLIHMVDDKNK